LVPSSLVGLALFVVLLAPGLAFALRHERVVPAEEESAFRESLRVIFVSVVCVTLTGLLAAAIRSRYPHSTPNVGTLVRSPAGYARSHYAELTWWALAAVGFATLLAVVAADPRITRNLSRAGESRVARWLTGSTHANIKQGTAVYGLVHMFDNTKSGRGRVHITATMTDGTLVHGYLKSYDVGADEHGEFVLSEPMLTTKNGQTPYDAHYAVISSSNFTRLDLTHLAPAAATVKPRQSWLGLLEPDPEAPPSALSIRPSVPA
jgi:hypothetical protein